MTLKETIKNALNGNVSVDVKYQTETDFGNNEFIRIIIGNEQIAKVCPIVLDRKEWQNEIASAIAELKSEDGFGNIHSVIEFRKELHFYYSGCSNSCFHYDLPVRISLAENEVVKTGVITEEYQYAGWSKAKELIDKYPDYELYKRAGFGFKGAQESRTDVEGIKRLCDWACCCDIYVRDNEIHVNGFSLSDMD